MTNRSRKTSTSDQQDCIAFRGFLIRTNPLNGYIWIEKGGARIASASSIEDAKAQIALLADLSE